MQQPNEQASTEQPKQLPAHIQEQVDRMRAAGMHVEVITDPSQLKPLLNSTQEQQLHELAMQYRAAAYLFLNKWRREAWRFWASVACNVVLLAWVWVR
jgi:uncharacterized protein with von Willebrand factor type A (vWA) domain